MRNKSWKLPWISPTIIISPFIIWILGSFSKIWRTSSHNSIKRFSSNDGMGFPSFDWYPTSRIFSSECSPIKEYEDNIYSADWVITFFEY